MTQPSEIEVSFYENEFTLRTHETYAMSAGIDVLHMLEKHEALSVKNTGWKNGFGLPVAEWQPIIESLNLRAEVHTDGNEFRIRKVSGGDSEFKDLYDLVVSFLEVRGDSN